MLAAIRTKRPEVVIDWTGRILGMKDGCRRSRHRGGSDGGLGRDLHFDEMGSKQKNAAECDWHWPWRQSAEGAVAEVRQRRA